MDQFNKPNSQFKNYKNVFENLLKTQNVDTESPVVSAMITYDATRIIVVTKKSEKYYIIKQYSLDDGKLHFEEGFMGNYIKMKDVEQNLAGTKFAVCYNDDGIYKLRIFDKYNRTPEQIADSEFNINDIVGIKDNNSMMISNFPDPFITCCYIKDDLLFIDLFYTYTFTHYHFFFNTKMKKVVGEIVSFDLGDSRKNFPYKCFYNEELDEVYSFYRQGYSLIVPQYDAT